jgi:hypothetical protein
MEQSSTTPVTSADPSRAAGTLTVISGGAAYAFAGPVAIAAQIPVTTTTQPPPGTTAPAGPEEPSGPTDNSGLVTIIGVAAFVGAVMTILIKGKKPAVK